VLHDDGVKGGIVKGERKRAAMNVAHRSAQADELGQRLTSSVQDFAKLNPAHICAEAAGKAPRWAAHPAANVKHVLAWCDRGHRREPIGRREAAHVDHVDCVKVRCLGAIWRNASILKERERSVDRNGELRPMSCYFLPLIRNHGALPRVSWVVASTPA
jgi:hypothetical protein